MKKIKFKYSNDFEYFIDISNKGIRFSICRSYGRNISAVVSNMCDYSSELIAMEDFSGCEKGFKSAIQWLNDMKNIIGNDILDYLFEEE